MRKLIKNFRVRYKQAVNEIRDLNAENAEKQSDYLEAVTAYEREVGLYKALLKHLISPKELQKLESKCTFDAENKKWNVPLFTVGSQKQVSYNKLKLIPAAEKSSSEVPDAAGPMRETWREISMGRKSLADFASMSFR